MSREHEKGRERQSERGWKRLRGIRVRARERQTCRQTGRQK